MRGLFVVAVMVTLVGCDDGRRGGRGGGGGGGEGETVVEVEVAAERLFTDYHTGNPAAADAKYLGKTLRVSGRVLEVEQGTGGGYVIGIETGPNVMPSGQVLGAAVVAPMSASERDAIAKIRATGQNRWPRGGRR
jgi:hypothetical protein